MRIDKYIQETEYYEIIKNTQKRRDLLLLDLLWQTGLKVSEVRKIKPKDIIYNPKEDQFYLRIDARNIPLKSQWVSIFKKFLEREGINNDECIWNYSYSRLTHVIQASAKRAGFCKRRVKELSGSCFRNTFMIRKYNAGMDIKELSNILNINKDYLLKQLGEC